MAETELKPHHVAEALDAVEASVSLNQTIGDGDGELGDLFADRTVEEPIDLVEISLEQERVRNALERLPERERQVMEMRFGFTGREAVSLEEIGRSSASRGSASASWRRARSRVSSSSSAPARCRPTKHSQASRSDQPSVSVVIPA